MSVNSSSVNPLGYTGINFQQNPPQIQFNRAPQTSDVYNPGVTCLQMNVNPNVIWYTVGKGVWYLLHIGSTSAVLGLTGDTGGEVFPTSGNVNIVGGPGVSVTGDPGSSTLTVKVFDTVEGTATTVGAVTANVITLPLGSVPSTYSIDSFVSAFNASTPAGAAYAVTAGARTTGSVASILGSPMDDNFEDVALEATGVDYVASGNNLIIQVTGVAGLTIDWKARVEYLVVG